MSILLSYFPVKYNFNSYNRACRSKCSFAEQNREIHFIAEKLNEIYSYFLKTEHLKLFQMLYSHISVRRKLFHDFNSLSSSV